jgi:nitrous oxidase accessory protein
MKCSFLILIWFLIFQYGTASVLSVSAGSNLSSVKTAVAAAQPGDTVLVHPGIYKEGNILIQKSISVIGKGLPTLDGEMKYEVITIAAAHVKIEGFHIINSGRSSIEDLAGIKCLDAHNVIIRNNKLENTFFGIHISNSNFTLIQNNSLKAKAANEYELGNGIHLWKCHHARIINNDIAGHRDGIYFEFVTHSSIISNHSVRNMRYGLHFMFSNDDRYEFNSFSNNGAGVAVMYSSNVRMYRNIFSDNWGASAYGLLLKDIRDSEVLRNRFTGNTSGIYMEGTSRTEFEDNFFSNNGWGIKLQASCDGNTFTRNNFMSNTFDISTNGVLVLNDLHDNYWDKYEGYDLDKNGTGDIPYYPVNLYSMIVERVPAAMMLWRSFLVLLLDNAEKIVPAITPENLKDQKPAMKPYDQYKKNP